MSSTAFRIRIRDTGPFDPWIRAPDPGGTSRILFLRTYYTFFEFQILKFFYADPGSCQPWIETEKQDPGSWILDKHPVSATLTLLQDILLFQDLNGHILLLK